MSDDTKFHPPIKLAEARSRRVRAGRAIVEPRGRPDFMYATSGPVPLEPDPQDQAEEEFYADLKRTEPKASWWERSALVAALVGSAAAVISLIKKVFS